MHSKATVASAAQTRQASERQSHGWLLRRWGWTDSLSGRQKQAVHSTSPRPQAPTTAAYRLSESHCTCTPGTWRCHREWKPTAGSWSHNPRKPCCRAWSGALAARAVHLQMTLRPRGGKEKPAAAKTAYPREGAPWAYIIFIYSFNFCSWGVSISKEIGSPTARLQNTAKRVMLQKKNENHHQMIELMQCNCARVQKAANSSCSAISMHACRRQLIVRHYSRSQGCTLRLRYGYATATLRSSKQ